MKRQGTFPFTAIIGQDTMKKALVLNVVNPKLGGVLIQGEKGTAKSTAVRAPADLLPPRRCIKGCRFHCDPDDRANWCDECHEKYDHEEPPVEMLPMKVVELPVSATEDRVVGTLDIEAAIREGKRSFETGILADANRNILYVDEINLLDDHVVDVLLDSAAMGINTVEREGISYSHPARFSLVGTMNPEEGDIRPDFWTALPFLSKWPVNRTRKRGPKSLREDWPMKQILNLSWNSGRMNRQKKCAALKEP